METHGSGSVFSVNTTGGIPVIEAKDDYTTHLRGNLSLREPFTTPDSTDYETKIYTKKDTKPDSFTTLLIHSDSTDGSTDFVDSSFGHNIVRSGDTRHSTVRSKFGKSSVYFDGDAANGSGDYCSIPNSSDFNPGSGDFTIDCWIYYTYTGTTHWKSVCTTRAYGVYSGLIFTVHPDNKLWFTADDNGTSSGGWAISEGSDNDDAIVRNTWQHIALVRNGNTFTFYVNGISEGSFTSSISLFDSPHPFMFGTGQDDNQGWLGYIDEFRFSKGIARWTSNFTPPTSPYETDANTVLLIHSDTRNEDTHFIDSSETTSTRKVITTSGDPSHEDTTAKFGATSIYLDGSDYLDIASHADFNMGTGDFTMDGWFNFSTIADNRGIMSIGTAINGSGTFGVRWSGTGLQVKGDGSTLANFGGITDHNMGTGEWHHLALQRRSDVTELFVDGRLLGSDSTSYTLTQHNVRLGHYYESPYFGVQYMDEFRLSKGIARWTGNFDVPKRPYPLNEDKLLIKSDDGVEKTVIAAEPHGVVRQGQVLKATGEDGVQWGQGGKIVQMKVVNPNSGHKSLNTSTWTEWDSTFRITMTPVSTSNIIILQATFIVGGSYSSNVKQFRIVTDPAGTPDMVNSSSDSSKTPGHGSIRQVDHDMNDVDNITLVAQHTAGVGERTYGFQARNESGASVIYFNSTTTNTQAIVYCKPIFIAYEVQV
jgi:hypothetical protein